MLSSILKTLGLIGPTISLFDLGRTAPRTKRASSLNYRFTERTTDARHWHNPADPVQAARIALAQLRRDARADYRVYCAARSRNNNHAHIVQHRVPGDDYVVYKFPDRFNPFYVAH